MSVVKSFSVGVGDMYYINHNYSSFTIIDCNMDDSNQEVIINELQAETRSKEIIRFISTHPDEDHIKGLRILDIKVGIPNFYCVYNEAVKKDPTEDFEYYCSLRDGKNHFYVEKGCKRQWLNAKGKNDEGKLIDPAGISFIWPNISNQEFQKALEDAKHGVSYNNISPMFTYSIRNGARFLWMGDIKEEFLEEITNEVEWPKVDVLFAPHHGRESGKVPKEILDRINPYIIVIGEAPSKYLTYYDAYNTITQNSAKDIIFDCGNECVGVYCGSESYSVKFLKKDSNYNVKYGNYLGYFIPQKAE